MPAKPKALPPAPDPKRVNLSAEKLVSQALDLLASEGDTTLYANPLYNGSNQSSPDTVRSAGIPFVRGKTMLDAQKFRVNWYGCERRTLGKITRLVCERNWFASSVLKINKGLYGSGFRFADPAAQAWEIFNSPSFKKNFPDAPDLTPAWSVKQLYTGEALVKLSTFFSTYATVSPQDPSSPADQSRSHAQGLRLVPRPHHRFRRRSRRRQSPTLWRPTENRRFRRCRSVPRLRRRLLQNGRRCRRYAWQPQLFAPKAKRLH